MNDTAGIVAAKWFYAIRICLFQSNVGFWQEELDEQIMERLLIFQLMLIFQSTKVDTNVPFFETNIFFAV